MSIKGKRVADEAIYLNENRYDRPKEIFKYIGDIIKESDYPEGSKLLDAGCATGELIYYLKQILPNFGSFHGMDISENLIALARKRVKNVQFFTGSILKDKSFKKCHYDVVICSGVISIFDELEKPMSNLLSCVRKGGSVLIAGGFNDDPIDVIMRYRRANKPSEEWETGWNIFSRCTIEDILKNSGYKLKWNWYDFRLPFKIIKNSGDPMRCWTIATSGDPYQQVNGACQMINYKVLKIDVAPA